MAKKARKKAGAGVSATSRKSKKVIAVKSVKARKQPAKKNPPRKAARRSSADVAKLKRAVIAGARKGKTADTLAAELGISKTYVYALKSKS